MHRDTLITECRRVAGAFSVGTAWMAVVLAASAYLVLQTADDHWLGTLLAFGPRWALLMAVGLLGVCAAFWRQRALRPLAVAALITAGPVMGFCIPHRWHALGKPGATLRVLTCNTLLGTADSRLVAVIVQEEPHVIVLQEFPPGDSLPAMFAEGWHVIRDQELVIASRFPIVSHETFATTANPQRTLGILCHLDFDDGIQLCGLHLSSPRKGLEAVLQRWNRGLSVLQEVTNERQQEGAEVGAWLKKQRPPIIVVGDFNLTCESVIYRRNFGHLQNAFSAAGWGWGATKFTRVHGVRIDHVLTDDRWRILRCMVSAPVGSDHRPVLADLELTANQN